MRNDKPLNSEGLDDLPFKTSLQLCVTVTVWQRAVCEVGVVKTVLVMGDHSLPDFQTCLKFSVTARTVSYTHLSL